MACSTPAAPGAGAETGTTEAPPTSSTGDMASLCQDGGPLLGGDAPWVKAPFEPPGDMGEPGDGSDDGVDSGGVVGFVSNPDGGGVSIECSLWAQDCMSGEKCMPWANDGGDEHNATRCSPLAVDPAGPYDPCTVEGSAVSGVDDCDQSSMCWDVQDLEGFCIPMCQGSENNPQCPDQTWCWIGPDGLPIVCLPDDICAEDGVCHCMCPDDSDPDCGDGRCQELQNSTQPPELRAPPPELQGGGDLCPDEQEPVVLYMSNDDSNSQASPIIARRTISEGRIVSPDRIRIHEFLNYYTLTYDNPTDKAAEVGIQMRRTEARTGEFTLVLSARGQQMARDERPPLNLVFSLDTSGSMGGEPIELLKSTMVAVAASLNKGDTISMVTWDTAQQIALDGYVVEGPNDPELLGAIAMLGANGGTDLHSGLVAAYQLANKYKRDDAISRVMLISDGGANAGITDIDLIASEAQGEDGEETYLVGVGVGVSSSYNDTLMDEVTDAGKGAYVFIDSEAEAKRQFGTHFEANVAVVARNVRLQLTLPWYFGIKSFHGEEYSGNPAEVEPQHLGPNDAMTFHQTIAPCDPSYITTCDEVTARVEYYDPLTGAMDSDEMTVAIADLVEDDATVLRKSDVVVGYAKALIVIGHLWSIGKEDAARDVADNMKFWAEAAALELGDPELQEIADLLKTYAATLEG